MPAASFAALKNILRRALWSPGNAVPVIRVPEGGRVCGISDGRRRESKILGYCSQSTLVSVAFGCRYDGLGGLGRNGLGRDHVLGGLGLGAFIAALALDGRFGGLGGCRQIAVEQFSHGDA